MTEATIGTDKAKTAKHTAPPVWRTEPRDVEI